MHIHLFARQKTLFPFLYILHNYKKQVKQIKQLLLSNTFIFFY